MIAGSLLGKQNDDAEQVDAHEPPPCDAFSHPLFLWALVSLSVPVSGGGR
jgi:hypothetical protein